MSSVLDVSEMLSSWEKCGTGAWERICLEKLEGCPEKNPVVSASTFHVPWLGTFWTALVELGIGKNI